MHELAELIKRIVDPVQQHRLVSNNDTFLIEPLSPQTGDPAGLLLVVDMRMDADLFTHLSTFLTQFNHGVDPAVIRINKPTGRHAQAFGCETETFDMRDIQQPISQINDLLGLKKIGIPSGNHNVVQRRRVFDILESGLPLFHEREEPHFLDGLGLRAHGVGSKTESAIDGTN